MTSAIERMRARLRSFDLTGLLVDELGWDHHPGASITISAKEQHFLATPIAEKKGFVVWRCEAGDGRIPSHSIRRQIETQITKYAFEHLIVFVDDARHEQVWQWVRREVGRPNASREYTYRVGQTAEPVLQRLCTLKFGLDEEEALTISLVANRVKRALNTEKVTNRFYDHFQKELKRFQRFIEGIEDSTEIDWYASLMLNRLMFIYFIQRRGFLDGDLDYLRNRLEHVRKVRVTDSFHDFYRNFLCRLFHEGLGRPVTERSMELTALLGEVPFLNGGIFDIHNLEHNNPDIRIRDEAFERLFEFFDQYAWHLDEGASTKDNEINPDVLGHIFEKSINQKEKGAYYTREDITGYMAESTIFPRLLDMLTIEADGSDDQVCINSNDIFRLLTDDPDRYIRPVVGHGLAWDARDSENPVRIDPPLVIPEDVRTRISDLTKCTVWDKPACGGKGPSLAYAHPRETWRCVVARHEQYNEVRAKLASGAVRDTNDLITLNLDSQRLTLDAIKQTNRPELLWAIWRAVTRISILDPTCGSGAFLFAAMKVLEPIYTACLARMGELRPNYANEVLAESKRHPSERYYILKSIVLNNLYGVDIMKEATEICKLRLFLKLVAELKSYDEIEPLPDIDFNIRAGNALVGFSSLDAIKTSFERDMMKELAIPDLVLRSERAATAFESFQRVQTEAGTNVATIRNAKQDLRRRMDELRDELDRQLASDHGVSPANPRRFADWRESHQPFHWCSEFFGVVEGRGGFDVVIGNPPFIGMKKAKEQYTLSTELSTARCPDVYASVVERSLEVTRPIGRLAMIVPLSLSFSKRFQTLRNLLYARCFPSWFSSFDRRPSKLFSGSEQIRNTIFLGHKQIDDAPRLTCCYTTRLHRWFDNEERPNLFKLVSYSEFHPNRWGGVVPKLGSHRLLRTFETLLGNSYRFHSAVAKSFGTHKLHYSKIGYNWLTFCVEKPPVTDKNGQVLEQTQYGTLHFTDRELRDVAKVLLNGRLFFLWWIAVGDSFHLNKGDFHIAPFGPNQLDTEQYRTVLALLPMLSTAMEENTIFNLNAGKQIGNYNLAMCRDITDQADKILLDAVDCSDLWDDIILEYSLLVRKDFAEERHPALQTP